MSLSRDAATYLAARPGTPFDRLGAVQHALETMAGSTHLAPVRSPDRILDVGAGLNHWLREIRAEFPAAFTAAAWTHTPRDGERPEAGLAVRTDLVGGLPFLDAAFDYVHHRMIPFAVHEQDRTRQVDELVRVTAPGGWVEIVETAPTMQPLSPATAHLMRQIHRLLEVSSSTGASPVPPADQLRGRGLVDVEARRYELPIGSWGGPIGNAMLSNFRAVMGMLAPVLEDRLGVPTLETLGLVARSTEEIEQARTVAPLWFVWGRRPPRPTA